MTGISFNECTVKSINEIEILGHQKYCLADEQELRVFLNYLTILRLDTAVKSKTIEL